MLVHALRDETLRLHLVCFELDIRDWNLRLNGHLDFMFRFRFVSRLVVEFINDIYVSQCFR